MKAGAIEPLDGIYKNAFNLILGAQGRGKTCHAEELIERNMAFFDDVLKFAPESSAGEHKSGGVADLIRYFNQRCKDAVQLKHDAEAVNNLRTAIIAENPKLALERGISRERIEELMSRYPSARDIHGLKPVLVFIDDMGNDPLIKNHAALFNDVSRRLRHLHLTVLFNAHQYKDLSPFVRANTQIAYLHGGLPLRDLKLICTERRVPGVRNCDELEEIYERQTCGDDAFFDSLTLDFYGRLGTGKKKDAEPPTNPSTSVGELAVAST